MVMRENYGKLELLIEGEWKNSSSDKTQQVYDPGRGREIAEVPFATKEEVDLAVETSLRAFQKWSKIPMLERVKYLFRMRIALEDHLEELAQINTQNHGKTIGESRGELRRTIENVESAISTAYTLSKGETFAEISEGIDEYSVKEPLGAFAIICPFNFPLMVPFWFIPYALVLGDAIVLKPSEIDPIPTTVALQIIQKEVGLPAGVLNLVQGSREQVETLIAHPGISGVTFVGSTPVAKKVYSLAGQHGKRAIVNGGAKNSIVVMPDAKIDSAISPITSSFFGNTGQRCLAGAKLITVGEKTHEDTVRKFANAAAHLKIGYGLDEGTEMGPLVSKSSKERVLGYVEKGLAEHAKLVSDGRNSNVPKSGFYLGPSIFDSVSDDMSLAKDEIFGPVASVSSLESLESAIDSINRNTNFGNMACIFTSSGNAARKFKKEVNAGNIGVNLGVAQPAAHFPFGGRRESFYGVLHAQIDTVDFFTDKKIVIERW